MLCGDLGGRGAEVGVRSTGEGVCVYTYVIHFVVPQKHNIVKQLYSNFLNFSNMINKFRCILKFNG